jgi:hypothetical protein
MVRDIAGRQHSLSNPSPAELVHHDAIRDLGSRVDGELGFRLDTYSRHQHVGGEPFA